MNDAYLVMARFFAGVGALLVIYLIACGLAAVWDWIDRNLRS